MAPKRDGIFSWINVDKIRNIFISIVSVENILRYNQYFTFENDNDLVTKSYVDNFSIAKNLATEANLTDDGGGGQYLPFELVENGYPIGVNVRRTDTDEVQFVGFGNYVPFVGFNAMPWDDTIPQEMIIFSYGGGTIPMPTFPVITIQPSALAVIFRGFTLTISVTATNAVSYQWYKDGVLIVGEITQVLTVSDFDETKNGSYTCKVTNSSGTVESDACVASLRIPMAGEILVINNSSDQGEVIDNFVDYTIIASGDTWDKNPMLNGQSMAITLPNPSTLEYRRFNSDGTPNGSVITTSRPPQVEPIFSSMGNALGHEFYIRNT